MTKAKMLLIATAALALAGGALAFKARSFGLIQLYTTSNVVTGATCPNVGSIAGDIGPGYTLSAFATITQNHVGVYLYYETE